MDNYNLNWISAWESWLKQYDTDYLVQSPQFTEETKDNINLPNFILTAGI